MNLRQVISAAAYKRLANVDLIGHGSNQHEITSVAALRSFFGTNKQEASITWHYFVDDANPISDVDQITFYDSREKQLHRSAEWRLYYRGDFLARPSPGDVLVLIRIASTGELHGLIFQQGSSWLRAAETLFGVSSLNPESSEVFAEETLRDKELGPVGLEILRELGLEETVPATAPDTELVMERFGNSFPTTKEMSDFARENAAPPDGVDSDTLLLNWLDREEGLFRALERHIVEARVKAGFRDIDEFVSFSLSVHNRRKSRMGHSLQHHLSAIFTLNKLRFQPQAPTEEKNKPDFLFPGSREYHDPDFDVGLLVMLGAKSSLKDRWRQVLTEAEKIKTKHLCTLEAGISSAQTSEIKRHMVQLVIPLAFHKTYTPEQQRDLWNLSGFVQFVKKKQA